MKVYVDFKDIDAEDMPSNISNQYNLQVRSINGGSEYRNIELVSLSEHDKQVRREVIEKLKIESPYCHINCEDYYKVYPEILEKIQGE